MLALMLAGALANATGAGATGAAAVGACADEAAIRDAETRRSAACVTGDAAYPNRLLGL